MSWAEAAPLAILLSSLLPAIAIFWLDESQVWLRNALNLGGAVVKLVIVGFMLWGVSRGLRFELALPLLPGIDLRLRIDALSLLFVTLSAALWLLTTIYAIGYLAGKPNNRRFFGFFCLCVAATVGIALAGNLVTLFLFYELLTLSTFPLVVHRGGPDSLRAGAVYLAYTLGGSVVLLAGIAWLYALAGPTEFVERGGALGAVAEQSPDQLRGIFALLVAGFAVKAAVVPLHGWLPRAMVAPAPVSALLHAVAVVKAGAFGIVRVVYDVYGVELAFGLGVTGPLALAAAVTIIYGSLRALQQDDIKRRLAFSTVSQVSYIMLGTAIVGSVSTVGALAHLVHQGVMKITMFFCAGNLAETAGIDKIQQLDGIGWRMPWTMGAFTVAALGMIGVPPLAGFISKWQLGLGAVLSDQPWALGVLVASSLLNAAYFLPVVHRAWFRPAPAATADAAGRLEPSFALLAPPLITALLTVLFGLLASMPISPLRWAQLIATQEYLP